MKKVDSFLSIICAHVNVDHLLPRRVLEKLVNLSISCKHPLDITGGHCVGNVLYKELCVCVLEIKLIGKVTR